MPSQAFDTGWDFGPVLGLIESDLQIASPSRSPASQAAVPIPVETPNKEASSEGGLQLGNFGKLFEELGFSTDTPLPPVSPVESGPEEPSSADDAEPVPPPVRAAEPASGDEPALTQPLNLDVNESAPDGTAELSKRAASKAARKLAKKERKALEKLQKAERAELEKAKFGDAKPEEFVPKKEVRKEPDKLEFAPGTPTPRNEPTPSQSRYSLRSNVGAKVRPATPVPVDSPIAPLKRATSPRKQNKATARPNQSPVRRPALVPSKPVSTLAQPFTPAPAPVGIATPQIVPVPVLDPSQFSAYGTPSPVHFNSQRMPLTPNGYFATPVSGPPGHSNGLVPRTVQPVIQPRTAQPIPAQVVARVAGTPGRPPRSIVIRPQLDRHVNFLGQLMNNFPEERKWLVSPMQLCNEKLTAEGIHVFVDASNILIGFNDILRRSRIPPFHLSFDSLALLMERRRPVAKRVSASSHREAAPLPHVTKLVDTSKAVGYENNVKEQVFIRREESERKKFFKEVDKVGWTKATKRFSGNGSGSDSEMNPTTPTTPSAPKWVEQGVDEILHLKMCQSIIDTDVPTTIVLATGDGAEAEHSDGFLAHVERALKKGWKVELLSWRQQLNGGYRNKKFVSKWAGQFSIIMLDDYLESLMDTA